jgi:hypothetical protein
LGVIVTAEGCVTYDVSRDARYAPYIGETRYLKSEHGLWDKGILLPDYEILQAGSAAYYDGKRVADLLPGTPVQVRKVTRRVPLVAWMMPRDSYYDEAIVSVSVPGQRRRVRATLEIGWDHHVAFNSPEEPDPLARVLKSLSADSQDATLAIVEAKAPGMQELYQAYPFVTSADPYPYVARPERERQIKEGFERINPAMSVAEVKAILGNPDETRPRREPYIKEKDAWRIGTTYWYYLEKKSADNFNDARFVRVWLDSNDQVSDVDHKGF